MRRAALLVVMCGFALWGLADPSPAVACEQCQKKLRCINDTCWIENTCVGNLRYPQIGWPSCEPTEWGCDYGGEYCRWAAIPEGSEKAALKPSSPQCDRS